MSNIKMPMGKIEPVMNEVLASGGEFTMVINGTSMLPLLRQGKDAVIIKKLQPVKKDVILYKRKDGSFVLHRITGKDEKGYILCGDNQFIKERGIDESDVVAVMTACIRNGKRIGKKNLFYRIYVNTIVLRRLYKNFRYAIRTGIRK